MALSKRLFSIFQMIEKGSIPADIGCDHGLLPIALVTAEKCSRVYACDLRKGPLSRAKSAINELGLQEQIPTLLRDGMDDLPDEVDTIVIAGMGFDTIRGILEKQIKILSKYHRIIIQSNKHVEDLRRWISLQQYTILEEDLVEEDHFYEIVVFCAQSGNCLTEDEIIFGQLESHPLFEDYQAHRLSKLAHILSQMPTDDPRYVDYENVYSRIQTKLLSMSNQMK